MRKEIKIALGLLTINIVAGMFFPVPKFVNGLLISTALILMGIGLLAKNNFRKQNGLRTRKYAYIKHLFKTK